MEGGNEVSEANGITHSPLGELDAGSHFLVRLRRCEAARAEGRSYASEQVFSALPTSNQEPTLSAA